MFQCCNVLLSFLCVASVSNTRPPLPWTFSAGLLPERCDPERPHCHRPHAACLHWAGYVTSPVLGADPQAGSRAAWRVHWPSCAASALAAGDEMSCFVTQMYWIFIFHTYFSNCRTTQWLSEGRLLKGKKGDTGLEPVTFCSQAQSLSHTLPPLNGLFHHRRGRRCVDAPGTVRPAEGPCDLSQCFYYLLVQKTDLCWDPDCDVDHCTCVYVC